MSILDFAGASQATVSFVTNYGHRLYSDDFVRQLDRVFGSAPAGANDAEFFENQANPALVSDFFELALSFDDGVLTARWCGIRCNFCRRRCCRRWWRNFTGCCGRARVCSRCSTPMNG